MTDYVYLIEQEEAGLTKIGISNNPEKRLKGLQTSNPNALRIAATVEHRTRESASLMEGELHARYKEHRVNGEWFKLKAADILMDWRKPPVLNQPIETHLQIEKRLWSSPRLFRLTHITRGDEGNDMETAELHTSIEQAIASAEREWRELWQEYGDPKVERRKLDWLKSKDESFIEADVFWYSPIFNYPQCDKFTITPRLE